MSESKARGMFANVANKKKASRSSVVVDASEIEDGDKPFVGGSSVKTPATAPRIEDDLSHLNVEGGELKVLPVKKIRNWAFNDRNEDALKHDAQYWEMLEGLQNGREVIQSILVRPLDKPDKNGCEYEQIVGFKRLTASRVANPDGTIRCLVKSMSDDEALGYQTEENKLRKSPPIWSLAKHFKNVYDREQEKPSPRTNSELAAILGEGRSKFVSYKGLCEKMHPDFVESLELYRLGHDALTLLADEISCYDGPGDRQALVDRVIEIADDINEGPERSVSGRIKRVYEGFLKDVAAESGVVSPEKPKSRDFFSKAGKTLTAKRTPDKLTLQVHAAALGVISDKEIEDAIFDLFRSKGIKMKESE